MKSLLKEGRKGEEDASERSVIAKQRNPNFQISRYSKAQIPRKPITSTSKIMLSWEEIWMEDAFDDLVNDEIFEAAIDVTSTAVASM